MILIKEHMEKKTLLIKKNRRKKGMTLVEVMGAMAILSVLFIGISGLIIGVVNNEAKVNRKLESDGYIKNALLMFESGIVSPSDSLNFTVDFNNIDEMKNAIKTLQNVSKDNAEFKMTIIANSEDNNNLYNVQAIFKNSRNEEYSKHIYVLKGN